MVEHVLKIRLAHNLKVKEDLLVRNQRVVEDLHANNLRAEEDLHVHNQKGQEDLPLHALSLKGQEGPHALSLKGQEGHQDPNQKGQEGLHVLNLKDDLQQEDQGLQDLNHLVEDKDHHNNRNPNPLDHSNHLVSSLNPPLVNKSVILGHSLHLKNNHETKDQGLLRRI